MHAGQTVEKERFRSSNRMRYKKNSSDMSNMERAETENNKNLDFLGNTLIRRLSWALYPSCHVNIGL